MGPTLRDLCLFTTWQSDEVWVNCHVNATCKGYGTVINVKFLEKKMSLEISKILSVKINKILSIL